MSDETKAVDDFLGELKNEEKNDPFKAAEDPFATTVEEPKEEEIVETVKEEKPLPFNKDPKVQRFIDKQVEKKLAERIVEPVKESSTSESPYGDILKEIIGDDTPEKRNAIDKFNRTFMEREERIANKSLEEIRSQQRAEAEAEAQAEEELLNGFESIEESTGIDLSSASNKKLKGQFIDFVKKVAPKDKDGEISQFPDFVGTFETFQSLRKEPSNNRAKELSRSSERGSVSEAPRQERVSWDSVNRIFDKFSK